MGGLLVVVNLGLAVLKKHLFPVATISFLLFRVVLGSAREMCVFSIRQR